MAISKSIPQGANLDMSTGAVLEGIRASQTAGEVVEHSQLQTNLALYQELVSGGSGIEVTGNVIKVDLATAGTDYGSLTLSNTSYSSLDGVYTRASYQGSLGYVGTQLDFDEGGDLNVYYKDNGSGVWALLAKRDDDNLFNNGSYGDGGTWLAALITTDPTTITGDVSSLIPNYQAVDNSFITASSELDEVGNASPSSTSFYVDYAVGSTPAGLLFDADKLAIDFAQSTGVASSTKVFPSSVIKTYVDEQIVTAKDLSNQAFSNAIAQITGNPTNAQSALEGLAAEIDTVESSISAANVVNAEQTADITNLNNTLGTSDGDTDLGQFTDADLTDNASVKTVFENLAGHSRTSDESLAEVIGVTLGATDLGSITTSIVPDNSDVKEAVEALGSNLEAVQLATRKPLGLINYFHNANVATGGVALTAGQIAGTESFDTAVVGSGSGETFDLTSQVAPVTILVSYGKDVGSVDAGVYIRDNTTGYLTRSTDFDETGEIPANGYWQIINELTGSLAYSFFSVQNTTDPVIGSDAVKIGADSLSGIGNGTITEAKLAAALATKINDKTDKEATTFSVAADGQVDIIHTLGTEDVVYSIRDSAGNFVQLEVDVIDSTKLTVSSVYALTDARIVIVG